MNNQPDINSWGNVVIRAITNNTIKVSVNGELREIKKSISELETLLNQLDVSSFQVGDKIYNIGEIGKAEFNTIIQQQESSQNYRLRLFLFVFIPLLAIALGYFIYQYRVLQIPLSFTITFKNLTPNKELPDPQGTLTLFTGDKIEKKIIDNEVIFKGISPRFKGKHVRLTFEVNGFAAIDTTFVLTNSSFVLPISRNNDLALLTGFITDERGDPLDDVTISVQNLTVKNDSNGFFELHIPFDQQRLEQRVSFFKAGYRSKDITSPVLPNEELRVNLEKR